MQSIAHPLKGRVKKRNGYLRLRHIWAGQGYAGALGGWSREELGIDRARSDRRVRQAKDRTKVLARVIAGKGQADAVARRESARVGDEGIRYSTGSSMGTATGTPGEEIPKKFCRAFLTSSRFSTARMELLLDVS
jgi:hypothetical protein